MADLSKLFVLVPTGKIGTGKSYETSAAFATGVSASTSKIYFLADTNEIVAKGTVYGLNNAAAVTELQTALGASDATAGKGSAFARIKTIEDLITADTNGKIDKLNEVLQWFENVANTETGKALIEQSAANKAAIGDAESLITAEEYAKLSETEKANYTEGTSDNAGKYVKAATGLYKEIADAKAANTAAVEALDVTDNVSDAVAGITVKVDEVDGKVQKPVVSVTGGTATEGNTSVVTGGTVYTAIKTAVEALNVTEATVKNATDDKEVVSFKYSETDGKVSISDLSVVTKELGSVGLTKPTEGDNAGKWVAGSATEDKGLATAADVAAEIVADEEVIAAALNDHESRLSAAETAIGKKADGENAATGLYKEIADAKAAANAAHNTIAEKTTGHVTVSSSTDASTGAVTYTIAEDDIASAAILGKASVAAQGTEGQEGYVAAQAATGVIAQVEALENRFNDLWETYTTA